MSARIEVAEVLSFRLKVPKAELERLAQPGARAPGAELGVSGLPQVPNVSNVPNVIVETEGSEWVVSVEEGDSILRFRTIGTEAVLTEVVLCNDERGLFFTRVLGPLMVNHGGDLSARLTWNVAERNTEGDFSEVKIVRGRSNFPGLGSPLLSLALGSASGAQSGPGGEASPAENVIAASGGGAPGGQGGELPGLPGVPGLQDAQLTPEQREVQAILERARGHWEEYQRLKATSGKSEK